MTAPQPTAAPSLFRRRRTWLWLAAYAAVVAGVVVAMFQLRRLAFENFDTPEARAEWEAWREAPPNQRDDLPVKRRPPTSAEPPTLVLMRDYFGVMLTAAVVFSSLLFAALSIALWGALGRLELNHRGHRGTQRKE
jgi:hypothetical protein